MCSDKWRSYLMPRLTNLLLKNGWMFHLRTGLYWQPMYDNAWRMTLERPHNA